MDILFSDIWEILGIESEADIEAIRAAYSEKIKSHHPEEDPEGFMRLRNAYKMAIKLVSQRRTEPGFPVSSAPDATATFDFSYMHGGNSAQLQKQSAEMFEISHVHKENSDNPQEMHEQINSAKIQEFNFSNLDQDAEEKNKEERQIADELIERLTALYESRKRGRSSEWEALLNQPSVERLKHSEYFTWAFLDFIAMHTKLAPKINRSLITPFLKQWRSYWDGTDLQGEFDVANKKWIFSQADMTVEKMKDLRAAAIVFAFFAGLLAFGVVKVIGNSQIPPAGISSEAAMLALLSGYYRYLSYAVFMITADAVYILTYVLTEIEMRNAFAVTYRTPSNVPAGFLLMLFLIVVLCIQCLIPWRATASKYAGDIAQIRENRLLIAKPYADAIHLSLSDDAKSMIIEFEVSGEGKVLLELPSGLEYEISEVDISAEHSEMDEGNDKNREKYVIEYTENTKTVFSIEKINNAE